MGCEAQIDIAQLIYRPMVPQGYQKDYEFSRATMSQRWQAGLADARVTLDAAPWLAAKDSEVGVRVFDVGHDRLVAGRPEPPGTATAGLATT